MRFSIRSPSTVKTEENGIKSRVALCRYIKIFFFPAEAEYSYISADFRQSAVSQHFVVLNLHVICVMQIILVIQPNTFIDLLPNTSIHGARAQKSS